MKSNRQMVFDYLDSVDKSFTFHGRNIKDLIFYATGKDPYTETVLKYTRDYCDYTSSKLICLDKKKSLYNYVPSGKRMYLDSKGDIK